MTKKLEEITLDIPEDIMEDLRRIAKLAHVKVNTVMRVVLATQVLRDNNRRENAS